MAESNSFEVYVQARARIRDAARWLVTILGSTIVLIIGGGLIANIPTLSVGRVLGAVVCLVALTALCVYPLLAAIRILASPFVPFELMATEEAYRSVREKVDVYLKAANPPGSQSVTELRNKRKQLHGNLRDAPNDTTNKTALASVDLRIREAIEIASIRSLEARFETFLTRMRNCAYGVAVVLTVFLLVLHKDTPVERMLLTPNLVPLEMDAQLQSVLRRSGMPDYCFTTMPRPSFVRIAEIPGRGAVVLAVPNVPGGQCDPVRVMLTNDDQVDVAD